MESSRNQGNKSKWLYILGSLLVVLAGIVVAWMISSKTGTGQESKNAAPGVKVTSTEAGKLDPNIKYDTATGVLKEGGIQGEGTYRLERNGGGSSRDVALTSSTVGLSSFVDKKVDIWGETISSTRPGGWLMDVAKIKVIE